jgi:N-acetylneuraminate synthase
LGSERRNAAFRRSLYVACDVAAGEPLTRANVRSIRPGAGLPPAELDKVLGRPAARDLKRGEPLAWDMVGR